MGESDWRPLRRHDYKGEIPKIFAGQSTERIFRMACKSSGATIDELLRLRRDDGKPYVDRKKALLKLLKEIEKAYSVILLTNVDRFRFMPETRHQKEVGSGLEL